MLQNFVEIRKLSSCIVKCSHIADVIAKQENVTFKLAPKLDREIISITNFIKMRVNKATALYNRNVSSALQFLEETRNTNEYNVTALFIEIVSKWFNVITCRTSSIASGKVEEKSEKAFHETINFLICSIILKSDRMENLNLYNQVL